MLSTSSPFAPASLPPATVPPAGKVNEGVWQMSDNGLVDLYVSHLTKLSSPQMARFPRLA